MGGNLDTNNIRLSREQYEQLCTQLCNALTEHKVPHLTIPYFHSKDSFGDLDLLIGKSLHLGLLNQLCAATGLQIKAYLPNDKVHSLVLYLNKVDTFQVDFIEVQTKLLPIAQFYFSYNDLNNLVGKMFKQYNLSFGFTGLYYKHIYKDRGWKILLTTDPKQIYEMIDLDYNIYLKGFDTREEIFEFVMSSRYFNRNHFLLENLNHRHRMRDRKRETYSLFLQKIANVTDNNCVRIDNPLQWINDHFPTAELFKKLNQIEMIEDANSEIKQLFNGKHVLQHTQLQSADIGHFIDWFKKQMLIDCLLSQVDINKTVELKYQQYLNEIQVNR